MSTLTLKKLLRIFGAMLALISAGIIILRLGRTAGFFVGFVSLLCSLGAEFIGRRPSGSANSSRLFRIAGLLFLMFDLALLYAAVSLGWIYFLGALAFICLLASRWNSRSVSRGAID